MEDIDLSVEGMKVIFTPSETKLPEHLCSWTLYDVYVEGEHVRLVTDTGERPGGRAEGKVWRALEGDGYQVGEMLDREEIAGVFVRWYYGARGSFSE